jgi:hypothetical protein
VAFERREQPVARALAEHLTPHLNDATAELLTGALAAAALAMPEVRKAPSWPRAWANFSLL